MARNYLAYVTIGLAVALFLMTAQYWAWPVIDALFIDDADSSGLAGVPEPWPAHQWESGDRTEAHYTARYADCSLHIAKGGTGMDTVAVESLLICSQEDGRRLITGMNSGNVEFDTVPADFEVGWDADECDMKSSYSVEGGLGERLTLHITCVR